MTRSAQPPPDPIADLTAEAWSLYQQLAARLAPETAAGGRRSQPTSRPPLQVQIVSAMVELEQYLAAWNSRARFMLNPWQTINLTAREQVRCPYCGGDLIASLRPSDPDAAEVFCSGPDHPDDTPRRWAKQDWPRLGVLAGVHSDGRYGARPPKVGET
jgi:DNA-directed RNA polymerase subunit RPC12/RpoP